MVQFCALKTGEGTAYFHAYNDQEIAGADQTLTGALLFSLCVLSVFGLAVVVCA